MRRAAIKTLKWKPVFPVTDRGFSLIEVLIALAIFVIGILSVGTLILSTTRNNTNGDLLTQATMLARAKIEEKKREADVDTLPVGIETESDIDLEGNPGGIYSRECVISSVGNGRRIQVTVSWARRGQNRSVVLTTLI